MNAKIRIAIAVAVALLLCACASSPQSLIVGKWQPESGTKVIMEFNRDGTGKFTYGEASAQGQYKLIDNNMLELSGGAEPVRRIKVDVTADVLQFTGENGEPGTKYVRK